MEQSGLRSFLLDFFMGGLSACVSKTAVAPIDRARLIYQHQSAIPELANQMPYSGTLDVLLRVPVEQGFFSLWRGNSVNMFRYFPTQLLNFMLKDIVKDGLHTMMNKPKPRTTMFFIYNLLSGGLAGAISLLFVYPLDYARIRLALDMNRGGPQFDGVFDVLAQTYRECGISGWYQGYSSAVLGIVLYRGVYFGGYDIGKHLLSQGSSIFAKFLLAQMVTIFAGIVSYPLDTIRGRMMLRPLSGKKLYNNLIECTMDIISKEGIGALFAGSVGNVMRGIGGAFILVLYDEFLRAIS